MIRLIRWEAASGKRLQKAIETGHRLFVDLPIEHGDFP
jgi:hypothetical protein